jgi:hypothetical protein
MIKTEVSKPYKVASNLEINSMEVNELKLEIRKHHVTPGINVLDLVIDADGEKIKVQTQHKDTDRAFQQFVKDAIALGKRLSEARIE